MVGMGCVLKGWVSVLESCVKVLLLGEWMEGKGRQEERAGCDVDPGGMRVAGGLGR